MPKTTAGTFMEEKNEQRQCAVTLGSAAAQSVGKSYRLLAQGEVTDLQEEPGDGHTSGSQDFPPLGTDQDRARPEGPVVQGMWMVLLTKTGGWDLDPWRIRHQWRAAVQVDCVRHSRKGDGK